MARTGIYALIDELKTAASTDDAGRRIDRFVIDLEEDAKDYGWPEEKIAVQQAKLRRLIKATMREDRRGTVRSNFQAALDRLKASRGFHKLRVPVLALFRFSARTLTVWKRYKPPGNWHG